MTIDKKSPEITSKRLVYRYLKLGVLVILALFFLEVWIVNHFAFYGQKINELKVVKVNLELENQLLENKLADESSLLKLEEKAKFLGFEKIKKIEYLPTQKVALAK